MKRKIDKYDFEAFGQAIKAARKAKGLSRNEVASKINIAPRYIASIENSGQHPSLQIFYEHVTLLDVSVDQRFLASSLSLESVQNSLSSIVSLKGIFTFNTFVWNMIR
ncbi:helix-turn-helix domain-containing protein [Alkaliphilus peptidifermentans]|uniref:Helix-turn-helix n=1 Tax=Alkaliphilus peptidifermentans DSM 18978 TaxID=1120976 RepID=A0A1G5L5T0_9FIRM|nr:helix-turn-helix transcriptional regulator [Alkaliphilus peptidifermentans]SCZ07698.1 Helix-turn-helix [Alkaliphilus peptidifermentans DSM 18978]